MKCLKHIRTISPTGRAWVIELGAPKTRG